MKFSYGNMQEFYQCFAVLHPSCYCGAVMMIVQCQLSEIGLAVTDEIGYAYRSGRLIIDNKLTTSYNPTSAPSSPP